MTDLRNAMKLISGNEPTPEVIARITAIAHDFDIPKNDAMLPILVMLDQYHGAFSELPKRVNDAVNSTVKSAERAADLVVNDASKKVQTVVASSLEPLAAAAFERGVKRYIDLIDGEAAKKAHARTMPIAAALAAVLLSVGVGLGWAGGTWSRSDSDATELAEAEIAQKTVAARLAQKDAEAGAMIANLKAELAAESVNLNAAKNWASTAEGQLAYKFFTFGSGSMAAKCQGEHWTLGRSAKGDKLCMPQHSTIFGWRDGTSGWVIP